MSLILHIDTALDNASVCIADSGVVIDESVNTIRQDHAAWLHPAIDTLLKKNNSYLSQLSGVAVTIGPGSYTGLRIGLSAAKGFCYALSKPLITINTLEIIANTVKEEAAQLICPLVDARRMEVFTALYDSNMQVVKEPHNLVVNETSFAEILSTQKILFCGNGSKKLQAVIHSPNATFSTAAYTAANMVPLAADYFKQGKFADLAYTEPLYLKEFYFPAKPV
jgi:tRNA threonylcarbamoyladenosine biosynthesis protein TsaB